MKLSNETIGALKNFAAINSQIVLNPGNVIKTMSESKTILSSATIVEDIPAQIGIYDLHEFLGAIGMFEDPELTFDPEFKSVRISQERQAIKYFFSEPSILTSPSKDVVMPSTEVAFTLTQENMASIRKAASALGINTAVITGKSGENTASIVVTDVDDPTSNSFRSHMGSNYSTTELSTWLSKLRNNSFNQKCLNWFRIGPGSEARHIIHKATYYR